MKKLFLPLTLITFVFSSFAQNRDYAHTIVKELSSADYYGRAYDRNGQKKAADFIAREFNRLGVSPFSEEPDYLQEFDISLNVFKGKMEVAVEGKILEAGKDYTVRLSSPSAKGTYPVIHVPDASFYDGTAADLILRSNSENKFLVINYDFILANYKDFQDELRKVSETDCAGMIYLTEEPLRYFSIRGRKVSKKPVINVDPSSVDKNFREISVNIRSQFHEKIASQNVTGYIPGNKDPEKFILFIAHYDHLGCLGKDAYFPGADDNASGVAMLLDLASYYMQTGNRPDHSVAFIACGSEEIGLLGSGHFVENPLMPLENIMMVVNFDMISFGNQGLKVFNAVECPDAFDLLNRINETNDYVPALEAHENSSHSDHFPFTEKEVPALFFSTGTMAAPDYHTIRDTYRNTPLDRWEGIFRLVRDFTGEFAGSVTGDITSTL